MVGQRLPSGVVTFVLSDVVGSTRLWEKAPDAMDAALGRHDDIVAKAVTAHGGNLLKARGEGDSTFSVFAAGYRCRARRVRGAGCVARRAVANQPRLRRPLGGAHWRGGRARRRLLRPHCEQSRSAARVGQRRRGVSQQHYHSPGRRSLASAGATRGGRRRQTARSRSCRARTCPGRSRLGAAAFRCGT